MKRYHPKQLYQGIPIILPTTLLFLFLAFVFVKFHVPESFNTNKICLSS